MDKLFRKFKAFVFEKLFSKNSGDIIYDFENDKVFELKKQLTKEEIVKDNDIYFDSLTNQIKLKLNEMNEKELIIYKKDIRKNLMNMYDLFFKEEE